MKVLATLFLLFSLPGIHFNAPARKPIPSAPTKQQSVRKGGRWYLAANGHAVYCYGRVVIMPDVYGGIQSVATFCQGDKPMVPLKD